jgi:hypothetical protein
MRRHTFQLVRGRRRLTGMRCDRLGSYSCDENARAVHSCMSEVLQYFVVANLAFTTVTIQTGDFSNVHNFVKNFVWDPIQSTYFSESRGASFAPKKFGNNEN